MSKEVEVNLKLNALYIDSLALKKIQYWTDAADGEVSGLGIIEQEDGKMIVKEAYILDQECTGSDTELDPSAISKLMTNILRDGKDSGKLKFWWHSHVNMGVFWSGTDDECAETLSTEYAFSLVVNKKQDRRVRLDIYDPFRITVDHVRLIELSIEDSDLKKQCEEDVKDKVKSKVYRYNNSDRDWTGGYFGGRHRDYSSYVEEEEDRKKKPAGWGKRIKIKEEDIEDIKRLQEVVHNMKFTSEAIAEYVSGTMSDVMNVLFEKDAGCSDGPGDYSDDDEICEKCTINKICKILSEKISVPEGEGDNSVPEINPNEGDIEITVDADEGDGDKND